MVPVLVGDDGQIEVTAAGVADVFRHLLHSRSGILGDADQAAIDEDGVIPPDFVVGKAQQKTVAETVAVHPDGGSAGRHRHREGCRRSISGLIRSFRFAFQ
ncbi:MAG: hypothetical protein ACD_75C01221G0003 [uncultured bacterium]|nr:MAG: hypothetical protein ACD_75C01221G0003 [uncultured bacterium]